MINLFEASFSNGDRLLFMCKIELLTSILVFVGNLSDYGSVVVSSAIDPSTIV